ncbi:MAG: SocA family protein [Bacteroidales bacterium]
MTNLYDISNFKVSDISNLWMLDICKIKAMILYIFNLYDYTDTCISIFRRMYLIQKEYLARYGGLLIDDSFFACRYGSIPAFTYKALHSALHKFRDVPDDLKRFASSFTLVEEYLEPYMKDINTDIDSIWATEISSNEAPNMNFFSALEIRVIKRVMKKYEKINIQQMYGDTHDDAWEKAMERAAINPKESFLSLVDIASAGGASKAMLDYIRSKYASNPYCREE